MTEQESSFVRPGLAATLHDPEARFLPFLAASATALGSYERVVIAATEPTHCLVIETLIGQGVHVIGVPPGAVGSARRAALEAASACTAPVFACDFDRWLHWRLHAPDELAGLFARIAAIRPAPWYVCLGRSDRAFATHPRVQQAAESATNHALGLAVGRAIDATAGASWLSPEGCAVVREGSREQSAATDLEWPALVHRAAPDRLGFLALEGLAFETATFYPDEISVAGSVDAWIEQRYERPEVWAQRLRLAADSVAALVRLLEQR